MLSPRLSSSCSCSIRDRAVVARSRDSSRVSGSLRWPTSEAHSQDLWGCSLHRTALRCGVDANMQRLVLSSIRHFAMLCSECGKMHGGKARIGKSVQVLSVPSCPFSSVEHGTSRRLAMTDAFMCALREAGVRSREVATFCIR
jgi:hypothetical protein